MVKFRGIEVSLTSQFDVRKLPEFAIPPHLCSQQPIPRRVADIEADPFIESIVAPVSFQPTPEFATKKSIASCFVAICPGSQVWLEYAVKPPHPPNASYFFKLLQNEQTIASWDCTWKNGYQGKVNHLLKVDNHGKGRKMVLQFSSDIAAFCSKPGLVPENDCLEVRVHRVEARKRLNTEEMIAKLVAKHVSLRSDEVGLGLVHGGALDSSQRQRYYTFQLLDPVDEPYATFRFYYRTYAFLQALYETHSSPSHSISGSPDSLIFCDQSVSPAFTTSRHNQCDVGSCSVGAVDEGKLYIPCHHHADKGDITASLESVDSTGRPRPGHNPWWSPFTSTEDNVEDLPSDTSRSPKQLKTRSCLLSRTCDILASPTRSSFRSAARKAT